jgi:hypothetical protein
MASQRTNPNNLPTDFGHDVALFPTWSTDHATAHATLSSRRRAAGPETMVRKRVIRRIVVLEVPGRLSQLGQDLDREIQVALADEPRGVVCDLSDEVDGKGVVETLALAGRHVRDWPGIPVALACLDPLVREAVRNHSLGGHLIVAESQLTALSAVLATPDLAARTLQLPAHRSTPRLCREFISGTLLEWGLSRLAPFANLVVSELVASSSSGAGSDIEVSVAWDRAAGRWDLGIVRLAVRDHGPTDPTSQHLAPTGAAPTGVASTDHGHSLELEGRGRTVVAGTARAYGVLPTADGGKTVWAVLEAPRARPVTRQPSRARSRNA